jgi:hypothetical protein
MTGQRVLLRAAGARRWRTSAALQAGRVGTAVTLMASTGMAAGQRLLAALAAASKAVDLRAAVGEDFRRLRAVLASAAELFPAGELYDIFMTAALE